MAPTCQRRKWISVENKAITDIGNYTRMSAVFQSTLRRLKLTGSALRAFLGPMLIFRRGNIRISLSVGPMEPPFPSNFAILGGRFSGDPSVMNHRPRNSSSLHAVAAASGKSERVLVAGISDLIATFARHVEQCHSVQQKVV